MARLGDFGSEADPVEEHTFGWYGKDLRAMSSGDTALVDFMEEFGDTDSKDPKALVGLKNFLRGLIHPDDFDTFWKVGREHGLGVEKFMEVGMSLIEAVTDLPTERSDDSSSGPSRTDTSSMDDSYSRVIRDHEQAGRPDLALVYSTAQEARRAG